MTTIDSSFIANGIPSGIGPRVTIGFYANAQTRRPSALSGPFAVGTLGVGSWGARNAAHLAVRILSI